MLGGSLVAVALMTAVAWLLRLGGGTIADAGEAAAMAEQLLSGFEATETRLASDGKAALVLGRDGSLALLKMHGARIAARRLAAPFDTAVTADGLRIASGDARFGAVTLSGVDAIPSRRG